MLVYLNAGPSLDAVLTPVEASGGRISTPKVQLPGAMGCFALITDPERQSRRFARFGMRAPT